MRRLALLLLPCLAALVFAKDQDKEPELHKIYVPYEKLDEVLGTDKERVMVPYKEFLELWKLKYGPKKAAGEPPVPFAVESAAYSGTVQSGVAAFDARIEIEVFEDGWQRVPLSFARVAFEEVRVDGEPGVLAPAEATTDAKVRRKGKAPPPPAAPGYDLLLRGKGRHVIEARFVAGIARGKELATCSFGLPPVPLHRLGFRVPGKGTEISIEPARAHTTTTEGDETLLLAFLGPADQVQLTWRYQPEETEEEPPLVFSTDLADFSVEERVLRGSVTFDLQVLRTPARSFVVRIPEGVQVLEVFGPKLRTWNLAGENRSELHVTLHEAVSGKQQLRVSFERPVQVPGTLDLPVFRLAGATRERGFIRISSAEGVGVRPTTLENVFQADLNSLPKPIRGGTRALGFRFPAHPYALGLATERIRPLVTLVNRSRLIVERRTIALDASLQFTVERAGVFSVRIRVPDGISLTEIGDAKLVDTWRESKADDGGRLLTLELRGRRLGKFTVPIKAEAPLDLAKGELGVPLLRVLDVDREEGTLGVFMDPGIKASATTGGVIPLEPAKYVREDRYRAPLPLAFAWRWRGGEARVDFKVEPRKPKVTCDVRYALQAEESRVRVRAELAYSVQYTGVETFRFRVPKRIVANLKVDGPNVREKPHADDEVEEGQEPTVTYTVSLQGPALGSVVLVAEYDEVFPAPLQVNESRPTAIPAIVPLDVDRATTMVALRKSAGIKADVDTEDYEQIDVSELPRSLKSDDVVLALREFDAPKPFRLDLTKHEYQPVADLVVRHTHLKTVVSSGNTATTTAYFEILNNDRQFLAVRLPEGSDILELLSGGKPEKPRLGAGGVLLVPLLTGLRKDATFVVAVAYTHPIGVDGGLWTTTRIAGPVLPAFEETPAPKQMLLTWSVHYPQSWKVTGFGGNAEPAGDDAEQGSWLRRAISALGTLVQPDRLALPEAAGRKLREADFPDIVPMFKERESVESIFTNGTGDATVEIRHTGALMRAATILIAVLAGIAALLGLARVFAARRAGAALVLVVFVLLCFAGRAWAPFWNGVLAGIVFAYLGLLVARRGRRTA